MKRITVDVGTIFGDYIVIDNEIELSVDDKVKYHVKCKCGKVEFVRGYFLRIGRQSCCKSCRCKINYQNALDTNKKVGFIKLTHSGIGDLTRTFYSTIKRNARRRNIVWGDELTIEFLWNLFINQNKKCAISGLDIILSDRRINNQVDYHHMTASLDRIDSKIGYVKYNVQWVHKDVNTMKFDYSQEYFIKMCKLIAKNNK